MLKIIMSFVLIFNVYALLVVDVELTHEKGLDDKTILKSELMSKEVVHSGKELILQMKNGVNLKLKAFYESKTEDITPETPILIEGVIRNVFMQKEKVNAFKMDTNIEKSGEFHFEPGDGQKTSVIITPRKI